MKFVGENALRQNITETKDYVDNHGGHKVINSSGTQMTARAGMQFSNMSVSDDSTNNKTVIQQTYVVSNEQEWNRLIANHAVNDNVTYYLPWSSKIYRKGKYYGEPIKLVERIIAPLEDNPATVAYTTGRQIIYNDYLYEVIQNIAVGDILIAYEDDPTNANIKLASPVETQVLALNASKVNKSDVVNNVTTTTAGKVLDARQGKALQDGISTKVNKSDIANNVTTTTAGKVLDARQGKALYDDIDNLETYINNINRRTRKNITSDITSDHGAKLIAAVSEQNLAKYGYAIGDYFIGASGYQYNLGDMDCNYGGYNNKAVVNTHHLGIVVDTKENTPWLSTGTVTNYSSSTLHAYLTNTALPKIKSDFKTLFGGSTGAEHLLARSEFDNAIGGWGTTWTGLDNCLICALTEVQVYGSIVFGADGYQTGTGNKHLEIFRKFRYNEVIGNMWFWLKSLVSASVVCSAGSEGTTGGSSVSDSNRAVGLILFH